MTAINIASTEYLNFTPASAVLAGQAVVVGPLVGIAEADVAANELGSFLLDGTFDVAKATGAGTAFSIGDAVFYNTSTRLASRDPAQVYLGVCVRAAATADTNVRTRLVNTHSPTVLNFPIEDLAADGDIVNRVLAALPRGGQITAVGFVANGTFAGVDNANTSVWTITDGAGNTICTSTFNATNALVNNAYNAIGTPDATHSLLTAGETFRVSVTNGTAANLPPGTLVVTIVPNR